MEQGSEWSGENGSYLESIYQVNGARDTESKIKLMQGRLGEQEFDSDPEFSREEKLLMYEHLLLQKEGLEQ